MVEPWAAGGLGAINESVPVESPSAPTTSPRVAASSARAAPWGAMLCDWLLFGVSGAPQAPTAAQAKAAAWTGMTAGRSPGKVQAVRSATTGKVWDERRQRFVAPTTVAQATSTAGAAGMAAAEGLSEHLDDRRSPGKWRKTSRVAVVLPPAAVLELRQMSGTTFCVNDVEQPSSHHASKDAATLLAEKAVRSPCGPDWEALPAFAEYMALPHKDGDQADESGVQRVDEVAGYTVRRLRDAPDWLLVQLPPDEAERVFKFNPEGKLTACQPYYYKHDQRRSQWNHPITGVPATRIGLVAPDSLSDLPHPLLHGGVHANGFIAAVTTAFAEHRPLALRPEHIWTLVLQAVAVHVNQNAEELRTRFVAHDGKLALTVQRDEFVLGAAGHDWAEVVAEFSEQIEGNTVADATKRMATDFSTTTADEKVAGQMTVMYAMEKYFDFCMSTECGFPSITLEGSAEDWHSVRRKAEDLVCASCKEDFSSWWLPALLPVLDRFVEQYEDTGTVDVQFWQSMAKVGGIGGSGGCTWLNGWYNVFFPQLKSGRRNPFCSAYTPEAGYAKEDASKKNYYAGHFGGTPAPDGVRGPEPESIPTGVLSAPVSWNYLGQKLPLEFRAGFVGAEQRPDGTVAPAIGWYIQHA